MLVSRGVCHYNTARKVNTQSLMTIRLRHNDTTDTYKHTAAKDAIR